MQLQLSGHHVDLTPPLRTYVEKKIGRIVQRFDRLLDVQCILSVEKLRHKAEATVRLQGATIHADAVDEDMYAAIDAMADRLQRRVRKHKERARDHHAPEAQKHGTALAQ
jgi:putative sigma-54 modulation protein